MCCVVTHTPRSVTRHDCSVTGQFAVGSTVTLCFQCVYYWCQAIILGTRFRISGFPLGLDEIRSLEKIICKSSNPVDSPFLPAPFGCKTVLLLNLNEVFYFFLLLMSFLSAFRIWWFTLTSAICSATVVKRKHGGKCKYFYTYKLCKFFVSDFQNFVSSDSK